MDKPSYNRHIEFIKNEPDVNPATGEVKKQTVTDFYVRDDHVTMWGWGYVNDFRPDERYPTIDLLTMKMIDVMLSDGHRMTEGKRFRDAEGKLAVSVEEIVKTTQQEAESYYVLGEMYRCKGVDYRLEDFPDEGAVKKWQFVADDGRRMIVDANRMGTYLPDVASSGSEIFRMEPSASNDMEMEALDD